MALKTPYATNSEADAYLSTNVAWLTLTEQDKTDHLLNGRYYIDGKYVCDEIEDGDTVPEEYAYANVLLAESDMSSSIFAVDETAGNTIVEKRVKAGQVESEIKYAGNRSTSPKLGGVDPYPKVTSLLGEYCYLKKNTGISTNSLLRA